MIHHLLQIAVQSLVFRPVPLEWAHAGLDLHRLLLHHCLIIENCDTFYRNLTTIFLDPMQLDFELASCVAP